MEAARVPARLYVVYGVRDAGYPDVNVIPGAREAADAVGKVVASAFSKLFRAAARYLAGAGLYVRARTVVPVAQAAVDGTPPYYADVLFAEGQRGDAERAVGALRRALSAAFVDAYRAASRLARGMYARARVADVDGGTSWQVRLARAGRYLVDSYEGAEGFAHAYVVALEVGRQYVNDEVFKLEVRVLTYIAELERYNEGAAWSIARRMADGDEALERLALDGSRALLEYDGSRVRVLGAPA